MTWFSKKSKAFQNDPDVQLMLAFKDGDDSAFERLMRSHYGAVLNFISRFTGREPVAEDLTQEVFLRIYRNRSRYVPKARFRTWMFTIARNLSLNELRRAGTAGDRVRSIDTDDRADSFSDNADPSAPSPEAEVLQQERRRFVRQAIETLPENQRMAVLLKRFEGFSYAEIAEIIGVSQKAVKSLLSRAKKNLRDKLQHLVE